MDFYVSASDSESLLAFRQKIERINTQVRGQKLGSVIKSAGFDVDGDALYEVEPLGRAYLEHLVASQKLRLYKLGAKQKG